MYAKTQLGRCAARKSAFYTFLLGPYNLFLLYLYRSRSDVYRSAEPRQSISAELAILHVFSFLQYAEHAKEWVEMNSLQIDVLGEVDVQTTRSGTLRKSLASHSVEQTTDRV